MKNNQSKRFDDQAYIDAYQTRGEFPAIHQDIVAIIRKHASEPEPCLDLGSCISLLSIQAIACGRSLCVSIEGNREFVAKAVQHPKVIQKRLLITDSHRQDLQAVLVEYKPTLVIARRVFPELAARGMELVYTLSEMFSEFGVQKIVLEGRQATKNATNALPTADAEAEALSKHYTLKLAYKNVRLLERI